MTGRERHALASLTEDVVRPGGPLPPVDRTDTVAAFERWLAAAPPLNRALLRAALLAVDRRTRRLPRAERERFLEEAPGRLGAAVQLLARLAAHCYYGDAEVSRRLGYDPAARLRRAAEIRSA